MLVPGEADQPAKLSPGDAVLCMKGGGAWHTGTVAAARHGDVYRIDLAEPVGGRKAPDAPRRELVSCGRPSPPPLEPGQAVDAEWYCDGAKYAGHISGANADGTYNVMFHGFEEDGPQCTRASDVIVRPVPGAAAPGAAAQRGGAVVNAGRKRNNSPGQHDAARARRRSSPAPARGGGGRPAGVEGRPGRARRAVEDSAPPYCKPRSTASDRAAVPCGGLQGPFVAWPGRWASPRTAARRRCARRVAMGLQQRRRRQG